MCNAQVLPAITPIRAKTSSGATAIEAIAREGAMVASGAPSVLTEVAPVRAQPREIPMATVATDRSPVVHQAATVTPEVAPVVTDVARVRTNIATIRSDIACVVTHRLTGRGNHGLGRNGGRKTKGHRGAERR